MYDEALIDYLIEFHSKRDYFECHEILEERWMQDKVRKVYWTALIQIAVGMYHYRRGNLEGAEKLFTKALGKIEEEMSDYTALGFLAQELKTQVQQALSDVQNNKPYTSINLAMTDALIAACEHRCQAQDCLFFKMSDMADERLLNRHLPPWREMEEN